MSLFTVIWIFFARSFYFAVLRNVYTDCFLPPGRILHTMRVGNFPLGAKVVPDVASHMSQDPGGENCPLRAMLLRTSAQNKKEAKILYPVYRWVPLYSKMSNPNSRLIRSPLQTQIYNANLAASSLIQLTQKNLTWSLFFELSGRWHSVIPTNIIALSSLMTSIWQWRKNAADTHVIRPNVQDTQSTCHPF